MSEENIPSPQNSWLTLVEMLRWQATHRPDKPVYCLWQEDGEIEHTLTYGELDLAARRLAAELQRRNLVNQRALLLFQPGFAYISALMGCLYAGVVAVPSYPLKRQRASERVQRLAADCQPAIVLSDVKRPTWIDRDVPELADIPWLQLDTLSKDSHSAWQPPDIQPDTLAFLQYTSGSTADPKGVMLSHKNLLHNLAIIYTTSKYREGDRCVLWLPPYHDMGLIGGLLQTIYAGGFTMLMSPFDFLQKPFRWLQAMSRFQANTSVAPNFSFDMCVDGVSSDEVGQLDLSHWQVVYNGAERVRASTLKRFAEKFAPAGFRPELFLPCYGLAESALMVTCHSAGAPHTSVADYDAEAAYADVVGCGRPWAGTKIAIVNPQTGEEQPAGELGEIWVHGDSTAVGYWGKPDLSQQTFEGTLNGNLEEKYLRTGDLGFVQNGVLYPTGRIKELIIIRGRNYYPQDIEATIEASTPAVQPYSGATFTHDHNGQDELVAVYELKRTQRHANTAEIYQTIRRAIATEHGLDLAKVAFIRPGAMPKTSSGKVQRSRCRQLWLDGDLPVIGEHSWLGKSSGDGESQDEAVAIPRPESKEEMLGLLQNKLAELLEVEPSEIRPEDELADFGISSINVVRLKEYFEAITGLDLPIELFFELETVDELVDYMLKN